MIGSIVRHLNMLLLVVFVLLNQIYSFSLYLPTPFTSPILCAHPNDDMREEIKSGASSVQSTTSVLCGEGPITQEDLSDQNIVRIVRMECSDTDVNVLVWRCLGYEYCKESGKWDSTRVFPKWWDGVVSLWFEVVTHWSNIFPLLLVATGGRNTLSL